MTPATAATRSGVDTGPQSQVPGPLRHAGERRRRLTWFMLLRVVVTTLLLGAAVVADAASPAALDAARVVFVFGLIALTYGLTLAWSLLLRRGAAPSRLAAIQIACDAAATTLLVHADGGAESGFVALYLMVIVGGAMLLHHRAALVTVCGVAFTYLALAIVDRLHLIPAWPGEALAPGPFGSFLFTIGKNLVLFAAAYALARRLAAELERAGEDFAAQGARLDDLTALHADVVRSMTSGLLTVSDDGLVRSINPAGEEILGVTASQIVGRPLDERLSPLARFLASAQSDPRGRREEVELASAEGAEPRVVGLSVAPLVSAAGTAVGRMINFQDLTELRRMRDRIERTERLAAIGRLAAGIAHEIRNPLTAISGSIELLAPSVSHDPDSRDLMQILTREVDRLNRLITDLLDFARPRVPSVVRLEVGSTLREILRVVENDRRLNPSSKRFQLAIPKPVWVDADPGQLRQVVLNLLLNAADASPEGAPIELSARDDGQWARIDVRDHGPGIPPEVRARIFEPFFTTKKGGTGLGLATVHRIVEEHHGMIEIGESDPGIGGTVFTIRLPRHEPAET